jgi:hypothetical protein
MDGALNCLTRAAVVIGLTTAPLFADIGSPRPSRIGVGSRAFALGNNYTALSDDFGALFHNPAGLGFIHAREAHLSMGGLALRTSNTIGSTTLDADKQRLRVSSGGLVWSAPTTRGGLAFALGYQCPYVFDDIYEYTARGANSREDVWLSSHGQLNFWTAGFGLQLAPGLSGGLALSLVTGSADIDARRHLYAGEILDKDASYTASISRRYVGYDLRFGLKYVPVEMLSAGLRIVIPRAMRFVGHTDDRTLDNPDVPSRFSGEDRGYLTGRAEVALGAAVKLPVIVLTPEVMVRAPDLSYLADTIEYDATHWKVGLGVGAEVPVFSTGLLVRMGYRFEEYDAQPMVATYMTADRQDTYVVPDTPVDVIRNQHLFSGGLALITKSAISFELSYGYRLWQYDWEGLDQTYGFHQGLFAIALRY